MLTLIYQGRMGEIIKRKIEIVFRGNNRKYLGISQNVSEKDLKGTEETTSKQTVIW